MGATSKIEWTGSTWTPIRARFREIQNDGGAKERIGWHCEHASEGCRHCYAESMNLRLGTGQAFKPGLLYREEQRGFRNGEVKLFLDEEMLLAPLKWRKPRPVFVCSMTDLFADFVPDEWIDRLFAVMALCPQHTFQVLTKRSARMREYFTVPTRLGDGTNVGRGTMLIWTADTVAQERGLKRPFFQIPLPNVWLGVSAERQKEADERIPDLLATPAAVRFVSLEPLLGAIDLTRIEAPSTGVLIEDNFKHPTRINALTGDAGHYPGRDTFHPSSHRVPLLDWVIVGGESGREARPMHPDWPRSLRDQCQAAGVAFFFKQYGSWAPVGTDPSKEPAGSLRRLEVIASTETRRIGTSIYFAGRGPDLHSEMLEHVGKGAAGRLLDGRTWDEMPTVQGGGR